MIRKSCKNNRKGSTSDNQGLRTKKNSINRVIAGTSLNVNFKRELSQTSASHYNNGHESKKGTSTTSHEQFYNPENGAPFLQKLYHMIDDCENYASWTTDGTAFFITNNKLFQNEVIPKICNQNIKFDSFVRNLFYYGFKRMKKTKHITFFNRNFQHGKKHLIKYIVRSTNNEKKGGDNDQNPDKIHQETVLTSLRDQVESLHKTIDAQKEEIANLNRTMVSALMQNATMTNDYGCRFATLESQVQALQRLLCSSFDTKQSTPSYTTSGTKQP